MNEIAEKDYVYRPNITVSSLWSPASGITVCSNPSYYGLQQTSVLLRLFVARLSDDLWYPITGATFYI